MDQEQAFLQAIVEAPEDDVPRLVYADWLEEQGTPAASARADLIRVQFALTDLPPDDLRRAQLEEHERALLLAHETEWVAPLRAIGMLAGWEFRRGFVERIALTPEQFIRQGEAFFRLAPVRALRLESGDGEVRLSELARAPLLDRLREIDVARLGWMPPESSPLALEQARPLPQLRILRLLRNALPWSSFAQAPWVPHLTTLSLTGGQRNPNDALAEFLRSAPLDNLARLELAGPTSAEELALIRSPRLAALTALALWGGALKGEQVGQFVRGPHVPRLTALELDNNDLSGEPVALLAECPLLDAVESLSLRNNQVGDRGTRVLSRSLHVGRLGRLDLRSNRIGPSGARALAESSRLPRLTALNLRTNRLGDAGLGALADLLPRLTSLDVSYNKIGPDGMDVLAAMTGSALRQFDLSWNKLGQAGVEALVRWPGLAGLSALNLSACELDDGAVQALARSPHVSGLLALNLGTNRIGDEGARALAESPHLRSLTALNLGHNQIGEAGARPLAESPLFRQLTALYLAGNRVPLATARELKGAFRGTLGG